MAPSAETQMGLLLRRTLWLMNRYYTKEPYRQIFIRTLFFELPRPSGRGYNHEHLNGFSQKYILPASHLFVWLKPDKNCVLIHAFKGVAMQ